MNELYIVLIRAHTGLGKIARKITGYGYTHIAVCTDRSLTDFVSYSRRYHNYPFEAGFTHEYRDYYAFWRHDSVGIKVFRLTPDAEHYDNVMRYVCRCENDSEETFNLFSMMTMPILHGVRIYKANNCMSFTARVIELSGCVKMDREYYRYSIKDMDELLEKYFYFEGRLRRRTSPHYDEYMEPFEVRRFFKGMGRLICDLISRIISDD
ncbi:hypothetical protein [Ruminococcus sp.]|uniref:hypothetical protein n=1 Tax=Ruminococcus sp. TaxID=41978 RepID=UPI0025DD7A24|nr:hypothetical protein [Ruminococcus sp.]MBR1432410.1 hypothetical protein [Ruminococcus sp.]